MQLHALDLQGLVITAHRALRQQNYLCLECRQPVRLRRGPHRQPHFYHLEPVLLCRQHQKGAVHLQLQSHLLQQLPSGDCQLELPFPSIRRIADVAWISQKIVFEIQCSPISDEEVLARNRDYQAEGWSVVWILHDHRFNQVRLSAAEIALRSSPYFYSNMDESGRGMIYDQFDYCRQGIRYGKLPPLPIDLKGELSRLEGRAGRFPLHLLEHRSKTWPFSFSGDLMSLFLKGSLGYLMLAQKREKVFADGGSGKFFPLLTKIWQKGIATPYQIAFRFLLERICR